MWDRNDKKTEKGQVFLSEVRLSVSEVAEVNFDYCEPRPYKLEARGKAGKTDNVRGDLTMKMGMVIPKRRTNVTTNSDGTQSTEQVYVETSSETFFCLNQMQRLYTYKPASVSCKLRR